MIEDPVEPRFEGSTLIIETSSGPESYDSQFLVAALLVFAAKGDGNISEKETDKMLQLVKEHFHLHSGDSLALLTRAMAELAENPDLDSLLRELSHTLTAEEKEDIAVMLLNVIAVDGIQDFDETELEKIGDIIEISPEARHNAFERYFAEQEN